MSRHRRQRNRRWRRAVSSADPTWVDYGERVYENRGIISRTLPALEKVLVVARLKKRKVP
jgi:hypothetical protein